MSTRSVIARPSGSGSFEGRYHHFDGYPSGLGRQLYRLYHGVFKHNLDRMCAVLLYEHPAGWSTIIAEWSSDATTRETGSRDRQPSTSPFDEGPSCYCHGSRHQPGHLITERSADGAFCEYAYVLERNGHNRSVMRILSAGDGRWPLLGIVDLDGPEPDWHAIDSYSD